MSIIVLKYQTDTQYLNFVNSFEKDRGSFHFNTTEIAEIDSILLMSKFYPMIIKYSMLKGINPDKPRYLSKITKTL